MLFFSTLFQANSTFSFYVSLCEINCIKIQTTSLVLNLSILADIYCVLFTLTSSLASDFFFSRANELKTCGLVQQLILRKLRDIILQSLDLQSPNEDPP